MTKSDNYDAWCVNPQGTVWAWNSIYGWSNSMPLDATDIAFASHKRSEGYITTSNGNIYKFNPIPAYYEHLRTLINFDAIAENPQNFVVDSMFGSGRGVIKGILQGSGCEISEIRGEMNPGFGGVHPEPIACFLRPLAGAIGALVTDPGFYQELNRPAWAPPPWLFGPVWVTLYAMMGVAGWMVWRRGGSMVMFAVQLVLNAIWTPIFFGAHAIGAAFVVISLLDLAIFATIVGFGRRSQVAAWLLVPYAVWVGFATALNGALWLLNR